MQDLTDERVSPLHEQDAFGLMFEQAGFGVAQVSLNGQWLAVNQSLCDLLGYSREALLARHLQEITRFDDVEQEVEECRRLFSGVIQSFSSQKRHLRGDGRVVWLKTTVTLIRDDATGAPASYLAIIEDLTPQKKAIQSVTLRERKRAEEALRNSEQKFSKAFEASPAILTIIRISEQRYLEVNRAFEQHTGFLRSEIIGRSIAEVGRWTELQSLGHAFETVVAQGSVRNMEARFRTKGGEALIVLLSAEVIEFDGQSCVLTVAEDITERKQAEDALRESEERFRVMADSAPIMMWMAGLDKGCTDFNRGWLQFTGRSAEQERGEGWADGVYPADLQNCLNIYRDAFDRRQPFTMEYRLRRHDGEYRWITDSGVPRFLPDGSFVGYIGCCIDVDDQKQAELARADLSRRLMTAQEAERTRIARELHDGIGQSLALLGIQMRRAGQPPLHPGKKNPGIQELCDKLKEIGTQVSRLSHQLHSSELEFLGLAVAVKSLCREFSEQYPIQVECVCTDIPAELDNDVALCFLRVVQEALHNIAKHSQASKASVDLKATGDELALTIADNGVGFDISRIGKTLGLGMVSMRERMHLIQGEFAVISEPGGGTRIHAKAPLKSGATSAAAAGN